MQDIKQKQATATLIKIVTSPRNQTLVTPIIGNSTKGKTNKLTKNVTGTAGPTESSPNSLPEMHTHKGKKNKNTKESSRDFILLKY